MSKDHAVCESTQLTNPALVVAAFSEASENVRHIRNERLLFCNAYCAIVAGGLAVLPRDMSAASNRRLVTMGLILIVLFSLVSLACSIRLVAELQNALTNQKRIAAENGMGRLVGVVDLPRGFGASMPMRWVFPIFFFLTTTSLLILLGVHVLH